jgi:hypothetical protein
VTASAQQTQARGFLSPIHMIVPIITTILSPVIPAIGLRPTTAAVPITAAALLIDGVEM